MLGVMYTALYITPFWDVYKRNPPRLLSYVASSLKIDVADQALLNWDEMLHDIRAKL